MQARGILHVPTSVIGRYAPMDDLCQKLHQRVYAGFTLVKKTTAILVGAALFGCASAPPAHSPEVALLGQSMGTLKTDFFLCSSEGLLALHMARSYISGKRDRNEVLPYIGKSAFDQEMAANLFKRVDAGEIAYHFDFATDKLYGCAARRGLPIAQP
jgi:hypothetical protein